jgi:hypothetical protein
MTLSARDSPGRAETSPVGESMTVTDSMTVGGGVARLHLAPASVDALVEAVAQRVVELLGGGDRSSDGLVDAAAVARDLGVSRDYVYEHADELGVVRLGDGKKSRLRFNLDEARAALSAARDASGGHKSQPREAAARAGSRRRRASAAGTGADLLPIRGGGRAA